MTDKQQMPERSRIAALLLALFLGNLGLHRFYLGLTGTAVFQLVLSLTVVLAPIATIWAVVDLIMIIAGSFKDGEGRTLTKW